MELPERLQRALTEHLAGKSMERLAMDAQKLSRRYRNEPRDGTRLLSGDAQALAYATARMPATYVAVYAALREALARMPDAFLKERHVRLLDAGAGTGAASWAADALLPLAKVICLEREDAMRTLGFSFMRGASEVLQHAEWLPHDLCAAAIVPTADVVIAAYLLNEISEERRLSVARMLWQATDALFLAVEPGTPVGFANLQTIRAALLAEGAHIVAPCPQSDRCPVLPPDWCHFASRVSRSKAHRQLKDGEAPYEDEKYAYLAFSRSAPADAPQLARVLRHPQVHSGFLSLSLCTRDGAKTITLSKRHGEIYKRARKASAGDALLFSPDGGASTGL